MKLTGIINLLIVLIFTTLALCEVIMPYPNLTIKRMMGKNKIEVKFVKLLEKNVEMNYSVIFNSQSLTAFVEGLRKYNDSQRIVNIETDKDILKFTGAGHDAEPHTAITGIQKDSSERNKLYIPDEAAPILLAELEKIAKEEGLR